MLFIDNVAKKTVTFRW